MEKDTLKDMLEDNMMDGYEKFELYNRIPYSLWRIITTKF